MSPRGATSTLVKLRACAAACAIVGPAIACTYTSRRANRGAIAQTIASTTACRRSARGGVGRAAGRLLRTDERPRVVVRVPVRGVARPVPRAVPVPLVPLLLIAPPRSAVALTDQRRRRAADRAGLEIDVAQTLGGHHPESLRLVGQLRRRAQLLDGRGQLLLALGEPRQLDLALTQHVRGRRHRGVERERAEHRTAEDAHA